MLLALIFFATLYMLADREDFHFRNAEAHPAPPPQIADLVQGYIKDQSRLMQRDNWETDQ